jgi:hypothetical protein
VIKPLLKTVKGEAVKSARDGGYAGGGIKTVLNCDKDYAFFAEYVVY